jgi:hypothetical protein
MGRIKNSPNSPNVKAGFAQGKISAGIRPGIYAKTTPARTFIKKTNFILKRAS